MNYEFAKLLDGTRWLMEPKAFRAMLKRAGSATPAAIREAVAAYTSGPQPPKLFGDIAVIDVCGPITYRRSWFSMYFGGATIEDLQYQLRSALADPAVKSIVFRVDSPGGCTEMVPEFADELFAARGQKPLLAFADTLMCSAAYWIGSQADSIYATVSSRIGAIGVFVEHDDISAMLEKAGIKVTLIAHGAHKVDGNPYEPLNDSVKAEIQDDVDQVGALFDGAVARGRGVSVKDVLDAFGQGDVFNGKEALSLGLADKRGTFNQTLTKLTKGRVSMTAASVARGISPHPAAAPAPRAGDAPDDDEPAETVDPVDGECPDGYDMGDDGLCHLAADDDEDEAANALAPAARADHTDVGRDAGGQFASQCACHAECACTKGDGGICSTKCMNCKPSCANRPNTSAPDNRRRWRRRTPKCSACCRRLVSIQLMETK